MKRCERCGYRNPDVAILCLECRARLSGAAETTGAGDRSLSGQAGRDPAWWDCGPPSSPPPPYTTRMGVAEEEPARRRRPSQVPPVVGIGLSLALLALVIEDPITHDPAKAHMVNLLVAAVSLGVNLAIIVSVMRVGRVLRSRTASRESRQHAMRVIDWLAFLPLAGIAAYLVVRFALG